MKVEPETVACDAAQKPPPLTLQWEQVPPPVPEVVAGEGGIGHRRRTRVGEARPREVVVGGLDVTADTRELFVKVLVVTVTSVGCGKAAAREVGVVRREMRHPRRRSWLPSTRRRRPRRIRASRAALRPARRQRARVAERGVVGDRRVDHRDRALGVEAAAGAADGAVVEVGEAGEGDRLGPPVGEQPTEVTGAGDAEEALAVDHDAGATDVAERLPPEAGRRSVVELDVGSQRDLSDRLVLPRGLELCRVGGGRRRDGARRRGREDEQRGGRERGDHQDSGGATQ